MGGLAGHMSHPYDNMDLKVIDFIRIVFRSLTDQVPFKEKLDGFNVHILKHAGEIRLARNKKDLLNCGFSLDDIGNRFSSDYIRNAYRQIYVYLNSDSCKNSLLDVMEEFTESNITYNCEIVCGKINIIPYDEKEFRVYIHNQYVWGPDFNTKTISAVQNFPANITNPSLSYDPSFINTDQIIKMVRSVFKKYDMLKEDTLRKYYQVRFLEYIKLNHEDILNYPVLIKELFGRIIEKRININLRTLRRLTSIDLDPILKSSNQIRDFVFDEIREVSIFVGTKILENVHGYLCEHNKYEACYNLYKDISAHPTEYQKIRKKYGDIILPLEGVTFEYDNKLYKWTGTFGPINHIIGGNKA